MSKFFSLHVNGKRFRITPLGRYWLAGRRRLYWCTDRATLIARMHKWARASGQPAKGGTGLACDVVVLPPQGKPPVEGKRRGQLA